MAVPLQRCIDAMAAAAGRPLTDDEVIRVAERLQERVERLRRGRGSASDDALLREASAELRREANDEAALRRRTAMLQATRYAAVRGFVERFGDPAEGLRALLGGLNTPGAPARFSIDYRGKALADEWMGGLIAALRQADDGDRLLTLFRRGELDADIAREMWAMPAGPIAEGRAPVTGNADAAAIARIVHNTQENARLRANRAGAWIGALAGYIVRQSHDAARLRRAGFAAWRDAILPLLDGATFERAQARVDHLEAERAAAEATRDSAEAMGRDLRRTLTPFAARLRALLEVNRRAAAEQGALAGPTVQATRPVPGSETMRANAVAEANQAAGRERRRLNDREADALRKFADRLDRMAEAQDEAAFRKLQGRLERDYRRVLERLDVTSREALGIGQWLDDMVRGLNDIADRRRRAEARVTAATQGLKDLEYRGRADDPNAFLQAVYDDIVSGKTLLPQANGSYVAGAGGSANVAMKMSRERVLEFRDADAWRTYHARFGRPGTLASAAMDGLQRLGRHTALIETLGPNPVANFERVRRQLETENHGNTERMVALRSSGIDHLLDHVTGASLAIENPTTAAIGAVVRGFNVITKLGGMVLSSIGDISSLAAEARFQGKGYLSGYRQGLEDLLHGRGSEERRVIAEIAGAGLDGMTGAIGARFGAADGAPGMMAWAVRKMYALNIGSWWTDAHKIGATFMQMRGWAMDAGRGFAELDEGQRRLFGLYGIGETEWDLLRASRIHEAQGRGYLVPAEMRALPAERVSEIVGRPLTDFEAVRILDEAGDRFSTLLADRADYAVPTPGAREISMMYGGHKPGSAWGEALRLFWQFKQFPVSVLSKPVANMATSAESRIAAATSIASFFLQATAMGYVAMTLKDVLKNKEPRPVVGENAWQTWLASAAQGGGLGIYGDFLFGEFNRFGRSWAETMAGPTFGGLVPDLAEITAKSLRGELSAKDAARFGAQNLPFANLFYVKPVLDQIIISEIYERLNPGYRQRVERDMQRTEGRGSLFHP